jgi:uncharacterized membrane protein YbhN (UPF0104 family)
MPSPSESGEGPDQRPGADEASGLSLPRLVVRALLGVVAGLAVAGLTGYFLKVDPAEVARNVVQMEPWALGLSVVSGFVVMALQALRWHSVMGPLLGLRYGQAYRTQIVGMMFNALLPLRGGDFLRVQYLGRRTGKSRATIFGTEIVDRWLDWWGWIPVILVLSVVSNVPPWVFKAMAVFATILVSWGGGMFILTRRGYEPAADNRLGGVYRALRTGVNAFRGKRMWLIALVIAPLPWLWEAIVLTTAPRGIGIHITLPMAYCVLVGMNLAAVVPSPGQLGTVEAGGTAALAFFGVDHSKALAFMLVYHFAQLLPRIVAGVAILVAEGESLFGGPSVAPEVTVSAAAPLDP